MTMVRLADGDRTAFDVLLDDLWPVVLSFAKRGLGPGSDADAEDVAQEVFFKLCARIADFDRKRDGVSWAFGIASYEIMTLRRRRQRRCEVHDDDALAGRLDGSTSQEELLVEREIERAFETLVGALTEDDRRSLGLCGNDTANAASATLRKRKQRTLDRLRELWRQYMANRDQLRRGGLRAYELGRLRAAVRAAWILLPMIGVCVAATGAREPCACIGVLLAGACIFLRWRDRRGMTAVRDGVLAGVLPLVVGLVVARANPNCAGAQFISLCTAACIGSGTVSGVLLGYRLARSGASVRTSLEAGGVAVMVGSLGCVGLGLAGLVGTALGLVVGTVSSRMVTRTST